MHQPRIVLAAKDLDLKEAIFVVNGKYGAGVLLQAEPPLGRATIPEGARFSPSFLF